MCDRLAGALAGHGLHTAYAGQSLLLVTNPLTTHAPGAAHTCSTGFRQLIACLPSAEDRDRLWFWWVWAVADDNSPVEAQPLCPVSAIVTAAERIVRVLAVREDRPAPRP